MQRIFPANLPRVAVISEAWNVGRTRRITTRREQHVALLARLVTTLAAVLPTWRAARSAVLQTGGLVLLDIAAWQFSMVAGLVTAGLSLFVLEWLTSGERR